MLYKNNQTSVLRERNLCIGERRKKKTEKKKKIGNSGILYTQSMGEIFDLPKIKVLKVFFFS